MKKSKVVNEERKVHDLDVTISLRSSRMKVRDLSQIIQRLTESLSLDLTVSLIEQDTSVSQNSERTLYSLTTKLQSED